MTGVTIMDFLRVSKRKFAEKLMIKPHGSVGADLEHLEADKQIASDPCLNKRRKTINLVRENESWGFTLQTYGVKHKQTNEIDIMTYVDYVEIGGSAFRAGLRKGDVILCVNGESMETATHKQIVEKVRTCKDQMRLVVLFRGYSTKVELHERYMKLKKILREKSSELMDLEEQEEKILQPYYEAKGVTPLEWIHRKLYRSMSDGSDRYSIVTSLSTLINTPNCPPWLRSELNKSSDKKDDLSDPFDPEDSYNLSFIDSDSVSSSSGIAITGTDQSDCSSHKSTENCTNKFQSIDINGNRENECLRKNGTISNSLEVQKIVSSLHGVSVSSKQEDEEEKGDEKCRSKKKKEITVISVTNSELNRNTENLTVNDGDSKLESYTSNRIRHRSEPQTEVYINEVDEDTKL